MADDSLNVVVAAAAMVVATVGNVPAVVVDVAVAVAVAVAADTAVVEIVLDGYLTAHGTSLDPLDCKHPVVYLCNKLDP